MSSLNHFQKRALYLKTFSQHSSFLSGGLVSSAGLIRVRDGQIMALSPLSGHYRSSMVRIS